MAEDISTVTCPDAVGPGRSYQGGNLKSYSKFDAYIKRQQLCHHLSSLFLPLPRVVKILDCEKFGRRAACADWEFRPGWLAKRGQGE